MPIHNVHFLGVDVRTWMLIGQIPFLAFIIALYLGGRRKGWPWRSAIVATAAFVAGLGVGTAFLPSVLGASAGGIAFWFLAQKALGLRQAPTAVLGLGLVALIAVGRWGCLLNGCCFGTITDVPWAVHYASGSSPHFLHQSLGLLREGAEQSLAVHPYPAYESFGLLLWLPFALWLSCKLRSQGALLALCAAFDLGLRGFIDGYRAMVNVWWSLLGAWHGLNLFQWILFAGAASLALLGFLFEYRARRTALKTEDQSAPSSSRLWLVFLGLLAVAWAGDSGQTAFVHRALLLALAGCVPALAIPHGLGTYLRARPWFGHAIAGTLVIIIGVHLEAGADAVQAGDEPARSWHSARPRTWLYDVDLRRGVMIRIGSDGDDARTLEHREDALGLPRLAVNAKQLLAQSSLGTAQMGLRLPPSKSQAVAPGSTALEPSAEPTRRSHTWIGGGGHLAGYSSSETIKTTDTSSSGSTDSCSGMTYTTVKTHERQAWGAWGQVEQEIPHGQANVIWIGGRAGSSAEMQRDTETGGGPGAKDSSSQSSYSAYYLNLWGEYESPSSAFGIGVLGNFSATQGTIVYPAFHLRAGSPRLGLDLGFADRMSFLSQQNGHLGLSVAIRRGDQVRHPNDLKARLLFGVFLFPGADMHRFDVAPGFASEIFINSRAAVGLNTAIWVNQVFAGIHLRTVVGP